MRSLTHQLCLGPWPNFLFVDSGDICINFYQLRVHAPVLFSSKFPSMHNSSTNWTASRSSKFKPATKSPDVHLRICTSTCTTSFQLAMQNFNSCIQKLPRPR